MKKKFIVALDSSTEKQSEEFKKFIRKNKLSWWHWINNVWLITDQKGKFEAYQLRDKLVEICPNVNSLVIEINKNKDTWSGFGPSSDSKNMFEWLKSTWSKDLD